MIYLAIWFVASPIIGLALAEWMKRCGESGTNPEAERVVA